MMNHSHKPHLGIYEKAISSTLSWEEKLCLAWQSGYDFMELSVDTTKPRLHRLYDPTFSARLTEAMDRTGFRVQTMALTVNRTYPLGSEDTAVRDMGMELVKRAVRLASETGIRVIHLAAYDELGEKRNRHTEELFREAARICAREAEASGVMLALETMDTGGYCGMEEILSLLQEVDSPFLKCYVDIGNLTATGHDPVQAFALGRGSVVGVHLKDALPGVCRDVPFGEGVVDFERSLQALSSMEYRGFFVAEMWSYDKESFHEQLIPINQFLRERLDAAYA